MNVSLLIKKLAVIIIFIPLHPVDILIIIVATYVCFVNRRRFKSFNQRFFFKL